MGRFCLFLPELGFEGTDSHAGDIGHWLGMTERGGTDPHAGDTGHWLGMTEGGGTAGCGRPVERHFLP